MQIDKISTILLGLPNFVFHVLEIGRQIDRWRRVNIHSGGGAKNINTINYLLIEFT